MKSLPTLGFLLAFVLFCVVLGRFILHRSTGPTSDPGPGVSRELESEADALNKKGPYLLNAETRFDQAQAGPGMLMTHYFTFVNHASGDLDPKSTRDSAQSILQPQACAERSVKAAMQNGVNTVYVYRASNGVEVARIEMNANSCRQPGG